MLLSPKTIDSQRQTRPTLIVRDLAKAGIEPGQVYESLLRRGVFKWFGVRRKLIRLRDTWKDRITTSIATQKSCTGAKVQYWRGYRKAIEECRKEMDALCHSDRWQVPDNDELAERWMSYYGDILNFKTGRKEKEDS